MSELFSDSMLEFLSGSEDKYDIDTLFKNVPLDCSVAPYQPAPPACASSKPHPQVTLQELECLKAWSGNTINLW